MRTGLLVNNAPIHEAYGPQQSGLETHKPTESGDVRSAQHRAQMGWGLVGFLVGAVFWHFVGFWGFVRDVVYNGRSTEEYFVEQTGRDCVSLQLDRATGAVTSVRCPAHAPLLNEGILATRQDMAIRGAPLRASRIGGPIRLTSGD